MSQPSAEATSDKPLRYRRVLLKISGEALMGKGLYGIDNETVNQMVKRVALLLGESDEKFILSISVDALDADAAENMENMINGLIGFARLNQDENPEVEDILKGLKTTRNEENVSVHFSIGVDKLFELIDPALKEIDIDLPKL